MTNTVGLKVHVSLRIVGDDVDPATVTEALSVAPSRAHRKGDPVGKTGARLRPKGFWTLDSASEVDETATFDAHATWLLDRIQPAAEQLRAWARTGWVVDLWAGAFTRAGHGGPTLGAEVLRRLGDLGLDLQLDLYPGDDDESS